MDEVLSLLSNNELDDAYAVLKKIYSENPEYYEDSLVLIKRFNKLKEDSIRGILSYTEESTAENKLVFDTIRYLNSIKTGGAVEKEPRLEIIYDCIIENSLVDAYRELDSLKLEYPRSRYVTLGYAALDIRKGLSKISKSKVDKRFAELYKILEENNPDTYKTVFCFLLIYKIDFYDVWEIFTPVDFTFDYNRYVKPSVLKRGFLLKLKLSSKSKAEIKTVHRAF